MAMRCPKFTLIEEVNFSLMPGSVVSILHTFTPGDQPQCKGGVGVSVHLVRADIRRVLHAAGAPFSRWPLAAQKINERLRLRKVRKDVKIPQFLASVLIRKRFSRVRELLVTQEKALYIGLSWVHHGQWTERQDGTLALTRMHLQRWPHLRANYMQDLLMRNVGGNPDDWPTRKSH